MHSFSMTKTIFRDRNRIANEIINCDSSMYIMYIIAHINKAKGVKNKVNISENN